MWTQGNTLFSICFYMLKWVVDANTVLLTLIIVWERAPSSYWRCLRADLKLWMQWHPLMCLLGVSINHCLQEKRVWVLLGFARWYIKALWSVLHSFKDNVYFITVQLGNMTMFWSINQINKIWSPYKLSLSITFPVLSCKENENK